MEETLVDIRFTLTNVDTVAFFISRSLLKDKGPLSPTLRPLLQLDMWRWVPLFFILLLTVPWYSVLGSMSTHLSNYPRVFDRRTKVAIFADMLSKLSPVTSLDTKAPSLVLPAAVTEGHDRPWENMPYYLEALFQETV